MDLQYFKRYRMEIKLTGREFRNQPLPPEYRFLPFSPSLLEAFSLAKYHSFRQEPDTLIFPCLSELAGCRKLMTEIANKPGFVPMATWLAVYLPEGQSRSEYCGTIQGIRDQTGRGAIQNLGVTPEHRSNGLGENLLNRCLEGFRRAGVHYVHLEVTAKNTPAIRLYRRLGFFTVKTVYKTVESVAVPSER
jgi:ribosomal protein S18 acetylase RimI-like enzyme